MKGLNISITEAMKIHKRNGGKVEDLPVPKIKQTKRSKLETDLEAQLERVSCPPWEVDYKFHSIREWQLDLAWPDLRFAVEVDGLIANGQGGHQTMDGVTNDYQKAGEAMIWGWQIYRCTAKMIKSGEAAEMTMRLLTRRQTEMHKHVNGIGC